ncbi:YadA C-terminal domain-containing protein [Escherichia coli]|uniref:YadA C-terminal domain-containing protein n=2 Tax=Escherichia coli TaxID=562 RepID=UPI00255BD74B|nr:YadA C-terminal domain-containing protein [Escherichia coli]WIX68272.1 YadA C-terminal domain-containing protein [Escherichia coli]
MLKRRDAFLKKSALAVSVALLLSAQAQAVLTGPVDANSSSLLIGENSFIMNSTGTANNTFLLGGGAFNMDSPGSLQFGSFSGVYNSPHSVTLGRDAGQAESKYGVAIGKSAEVLNSQQSVAIGGWAGIENSSGSVALGHGSQVSGENNVVSVGAGPEGYGESVKGAPETRRIINVSDGINNTDAATVGQLNERFDDAQVFLLQTNERIDETDKRLSTVHAELSRDIIAGTSAAVAYTDASSLALQDEIKEKADETVQVSRAYTDKSVRDARKEAKSQAEHLSDVLVKNRAQTDAAIASNTAAIRNNSHRLDLTEAWQKMATERMNNMQEQIKENRKELRESAAQSAALAGLFQPYSVGKFNATAAVGGYRDEQAIAVGVGYRFTENVAGKVAVAAGGSSASWNAGVNFEF